MALPFIMGVGKLDPHCTKILSLLMLERKKYRFNQLDRRLEELKLNMSRPTLIKHLKHLEEKELILREEKEKQFVTYRFNWERWQDADEHVKDRIIFEKFLQREIDEFRSKSVAEQIAYVNDNMALIFLMSLREGIVARVKPELEFMANINFIHFGNVLNRLTNMILDNVDEKGEKYTTECILNIDKTIEAYVKFLEADKKDFKPGFYRIKMD